MSKQWIELTEKLRKPQVILCLVFIVGVILNISLYVNRIIPQSLFGNNLTVQFKQLEKKRIALERVPVPPKITSADVAELVQQVPLSTDAARFILNLNQLEQQSNVKLVAISNENKHSSVSLANELISADGKANVNATYNSNTAKASPTPVPANPQGIELEEEKLSLTLQGSYPQLLAFMDKLQQMTRLVKIREWTLTPATEGQNLQQMTINLSYYSAKQYKSKFTDVSKLPITGIPENRIDPTISDEEYLEILKSMPEN